MSADYCARVGRIEADFAEVLALNRVKHAPDIAAAIELLAANAA